MDPVGFCFRERRASPFFQGRGEVLHRTGELRSTDEERNSFESCDAEEAVLFLLLLPPGVSHDRSCDLLATPTHRGTSTAVSS